MASDFTELYSSLGVDPDCEVETLKRLFRRRIAELHPDRGSQLSEEDLMMLYLEALRFHRRHGRFPGARTPATSIQPGMIDRLRLVHMRGSGVAAMTVEDDASRRQVLVVTLLTLLGLALLGLGIWAIDGGDPVTAATGPSGGWSSG